MTHEEYREKNKAACAIQYQKNREKRLAYQHEYYLKHKEEIALKEKLWRMGLLPRRDRRGKPSKGEKTKADEIRELDADVYLKRLTESKARDNQKHLQRIAEELRQAGYTVIEKENEDE